MNTNNSNLILDTYSNELKLKEDLIKYIDIDGTIKYSSDLVTVLTPNNKSISICRSIIDKHPAVFINYDNSTNIFLLTDSRYKGMISNYIYPKVKVYSVHDSINKINSITEVPNNLNFLEPYTIGVEMETSYSLLSESKINSLGFYQLYDGSISGPEYASGILNYKNLHHLNYFFKVLKSFINYDSKCSLHIHLGNISYSPKKLISIYSLFQRLQEDLNLLIAPYKKDYQYLYDKQKDHCQNLPLINDISIQKISELLGITESNITDKNLFKNTSKWNLKGRYYTVNFLNYMCRNFPNNTIEFRSLQMTLNFNYFLTWLIINISIVNYATKHTNKVLNKKSKIQIEDTLTALIEDKVILQKVLYNYNYIKNIIYNNKYLLGNKMYNLFDLDLLLTDLTDIIDEDDSSELSLRYSLKYNNFDNHADVDLINNTLELNKSSLQKIINVSIDFMPPSNTVINNLDDYYTYIINNIKPYIKIYDTINSIQTVNLYLDNNSFKNSINKQLINNILIVISNTEVYASIDINETEISEYINSKFTDKESLLLDTFKKDILNKSYIFKGNFSISTDMDLNKILNEDNEDDDYQEEDYYQDEDDGY